MKPILIIAIALCTALPAISQKHIFLRIFNEKGEKIINGNTYSFTDSSIVFIKGTEVKEINYSKIWVIKTRRSSSSAAFTGGIIASLSLGILVAASACPDCIIFNYTAGEGFAIGAIVGLLPGAGIGLLISALHPREAILINGKIDNFLSVKKLFGGN